MIAATSLEAPAAAAVADGSRCPFHRADAGTCQAAFSGLKVRWRRRRSHCTTDDYDGCALFLSRLLRSTRPKAGADTWPLDQK